MAILWSLLQLRMRSTTARPKQNSHGSPETLRTSDLILVALLRRGVEEKHLRIMCKVYARRRHAAFHKWHCRTIRKTCAPGGVGEKRDRATYETGM